MDTGLFHAHMVFLCIFCFSVVNFDNQVAIFSSPLSKVVIFAAPQVNWLSSGYQVNWQSTQIMHVLGRGLFVNKYW